MIKAVIGIVLGVIGLCGVFFVALWILFRVIAQENKHD